MLMAPINQSGGTLYAPKAYWKLTPAMKAVIVNGVGPKCCAEYIPNSILGLDITEEAHVHDYCWFFKYDFRESNLLFYHNVRRKIEANGGCWANPRHFINKSYLLILSTVGRLFYK